MRLLLYALALIAATTTLGNAFSGTDTKDAAKSLDGTWQCTYLFGFAGPSPDDIVKKIRIKFAGNKSTFDNGDKTFAFSSKTDFTKKPAEIDFVWEDGPGKGQIELGLFVMKNDELTIRLAYPGEKRPEGMDDWKSSKLIKLKRSK